MGYRIGVSKNNIPKDAEKVTTSDIINGYEVEIECSTSTYEYRETTSVKIAGIWFTIDSCGDASVGASLGGTLGQEVRRALKKAKIPVTVWD
jgi:hypothetical protein